MTAVPQHRMTVPEYLTWAEAQPSGRHELDNGHVVVMSPEHVRHNLVKLAVARALGDAIAAAKLPCTVFTDGVTVVINDYTAREPGASVQCGVEADLDSMIIEAPLIVVEVSSPSSEREESGVRLVDYFSVASIEDSLIVYPRKRVVVHYRRNGASALDTRIVHEGFAVELSPSGIHVAVSELLGPAAAGSVNQER